MIDIDFLIFEYLPSREILRIFEFYFVNSKTRGKKVLNLYLGNTNIITEIEQKYLVTVKCKYKINLDIINWVYLSDNENAIDLLTRNSDIIDWRWLSRNPNAITLLEQNPEKIVWNILSENPNAI